MRKLSLKRGLRGPCGVLLTGLALSGCTVGPDWHRPAIKPPVDYSVAPLPAAASQPVAMAMRVDWWSIYGDPVLSALEAEVATGNFDVREAGTRLLQARAERGMVRADGRPSFNGNASYGRERASPNGILNLLGSSAGAVQNHATAANGSPGFGPAAMSGADGSPPFNLWQYGFDASWELDLWGRVRREVEGADASLEASADLRRGLLVAAQAETARNYIQLRGVQALQAITRQNLELARHSLALTRQRFANGVTTRLDVANASAEVAEIEALLPDLERQQWHLVNALSFLLGKPPGALQSTLATVRPVPPLPPMIPVGLPSELARRRPDIRQAEAELHAATASIGVAKADFYPHITLSGSLDIQALQFSNLGTWGSRQFAIGPALSLPIFEGGRLKATLHLRKAQQQQAAIRYQRTVLKAWHEIDDALTDYNADQRQHERLAASVEENRSALAMAQLQYQQGAADFLNVLTVQARLLAAQRALIQATVATSVASASIYKALGGGWQKTYPAVPADPAMMAAAGH